MGSSMTKTTLREIRQSLGRYIAILAIVALGVGLFSGLKVTRSAMVKSAQQYFDDTNFYDVRLLSTIGFDTDAARELSRGERILDAQGAISTDALIMDEQGSQNVLKVHSLLDNQNTPVLVHGRMPQSPTECVVDAQAFGEDSIGTILTLSEENDEDTDEMFEQKTFRIVGTVNSPYYANYERGTTSLGNGTIQGFMLIEREAFDCDYDTEIFVRINTGNAQIYTDEYDDAIDSMEDWLEEFAQQKADERYDRLKSEGEQQLVNAKEQLAEEVRQGEGQLYDSKTELDSAKTEIQSSRAQIQSGQIELDNGRNQLNLQEQDLLSQKTDLILKKQEVLSGLDQVAALKNQAQYDASSYAQVLAQEQELKASLLEIESGLNEIEAGLAQIEQSRQELNDQQAQLTDSSMQVDQAQREYDAGYQEYQQGITDLNTSTEDAQEELDDAQDDLDEMEEPDVYVLDRNTNIGYASFDNDSAIVNGIANVFPIFFFLVAALVCITTMNRMVEEQRTQIGVLKALGYSEGVIMGKYLFYSGSAAGLGCLLGFFGGSIIFPFVIWQSYAIMYTMGDILFVFDKKLALISMAASMLCSMGTTYFSCRYELASVPAQLMRPKAPKAGKRILLEYIPILWNQLSFLVKVSIRNVLRYKKRFFMMVVGISGCTALLVTGFGVKDSIADVAGQQFGEIQTYGMSVLMNEDYRQSEWEEVEDYLREETQGYTRAAERSMDVQLEDGTTKSITLVMPENVSQISDYWNLHTEDGTPIAYPEEGQAVLNREFARRNGIEINDVISLNDEDGHELSLRVTGLSENFVYNYLYLTAESWETQTGEEVEYRSIYINTQGVADEHVLLARLMNFDAVSSVTVNADTLDKFNSMMSSLDYIVLLIIICAGSLAFIVLYNLTNINITERIREIATIKVLGFYPSETASYVFRENIFLTAIGGGAGLLLGKWLHWFVMEQINIDMVSFAQVIRPQSYLYSIALTFVFACIVNLVMFGKLEKINMAESLKSIE